MSVLWRPQGCSFFWLPHLLLFTEPKCSTHSFHHENTTSFRGSGAPLTLVVTVHRWDRKQGHPETAASSLKTFFTIQKKKNDAIQTATVTTGRVYIFWMLFFASLWASWVASGCVNLAYLPWKDMRRRWRRGRRRRWYEEGLDALSDWTKSTAVWAMTTINSVHST